MAEAEDEPLEPVGPELPALVDESRPQAVAKPEAEPALVELVLTVAVEQIVRPEPHVSVH